MFDNTPPNLPVEPSPQDAPPAPQPTAPTPPPAPISPPSPPRQPASGSASPFKKEPEDIFASVDKTPAPPAASGFQAAGSPRSGSPLKIVLIIVAAVLVLAGGGYAAWVFLIRPQPSEIAAPPTPSEAGIPSSSATSETIVEVPPPQPDVLPSIPAPSASGTAETEPQVTLPEVTASATEPVVPMPPVVQPTEGVDSDGDGLTDDEERLLKINANSTDSDGDGYQDGAEVQNGYDPARATSKVDISPSMHKLDIVGGGAGWTATVPLPWTLQADETSPGNYVIQTDGKESFSVQTSQKSSQAAFVDWLALHDPAIDVSSLRSFATKASYRAWQTPDRLLTYIVTDKEVLIIRYQLSGASEYRFRALYDYLIQTLGVAQGAS